MLKRPSISALLELWWDFKKWVLSLFFPSEEVQRDFTETENLPIEDSFPVQSIVWFKNSTQDTKFII